MAYGDNKSPEQRLQALCDLFKSQADVRYDPGTGEWQIELPGAHRCAEVNMVRKAGTTEEAMISASRGIKGNGPTLADAVTRIEERTTRNGSGFLLSSRSFGIHRMAEDYCSHTVDVYEGEHKIDSFDFDDARVRPLVRKYEM